MDDETKVGPPPMAMPRFWGQETSPPESPISLVSRLAFATVVVGIATAFLVPDVPPGLGLVLATLAIIGVAAANTVANRNLDGWSLLILGCATALAILPLFRDARWIAWFALFMAIVLAAISFAGGRSWRGSLGAAPTLVVRILEAPMAIALGLRKFVPGWQVSVGLPVLRGALFAGLAAILFGVLFASADGVFSHLLDSAIPAAPSLESLPIRVTVGFLAAVLAGALALMGRADATEDGSVDGGGGRRGGYLSLQPVEWMIVLSTLVVLFAMFVAVQLVVLFGGHGHVLQTAGLTYAEYARQGFVQLLVVAALVVAVVGASFRWAWLENGTQKLILKLLLSAICLLTLVILAAALHRLDLYVEAFGATRMRVVAAVSCAWIGAILGLLMLRVMTRHRGWLPRAAIATTAIFALGLGLFNPDARIAERNVERLASGDDFDIEYAASLSADATPALAKLPADIRAQVFELQGPTIPEIEDFRGYNVARSRALDILGS